MFIIVSLDGNDASINRDRREQPRPLFALYLASDVANPESASEQPLPRSPFVTSKQASVKIAWEMTDVEVTFEGIIRKKSIFRGRTDDDKTIKGPRPGASFSGRFQCHPVVPSEPTSPNILTSHI